LVEPASPPVHMASLVQQPAGASRLQVRSGWQVSAVHELPSLQSPSRRQQPMTLVYVQVPEPQVSVVHGLPSSQPWSFVQPHAIGVKRQVFVAVSHSFVVQLVESLQLVAFTQQSDVGTVLHRCVDRSHVLAVQALPSLQSASVMQQFSMLDREHVCAVGSHVSRVQGLPSEQSPAVLQQFCIDVYAQRPFVPQASVVQALPSLQSWSAALASATPQQNGCVERTQRPFSQRSFEHMLASAQSASMLQQSVIFRFSH
jgi:hypothetical protein